MKLSRWRILFFSRNVRSLGRCLAPLFFTSAVCAVAHASLPDSRGRAWFGSPSGAGSAPLIRVRILQSAARVRVRGFDLRAGALFSARRASEWEIQCLASGQVRATSIGGASEGRGPVRIETPAGFLSLQGRPYRYALIVHPVEGEARCDVINEVDLEKYLDGLISSEFSAEWSPESIGAQAVAARTYALFRMNEARASGQYFDVDATVKDQVYDGSLREDYRASRAAERTRGQVLTLARAGGKILPLKAFYHSTCGGRTELPESVWGFSSPGFKHRVSCPFCVSSPRYLWDLELDSARVRRALLEGAATSSHGRDVARRWPARWREALTRGNLEDLRTASRDSASGRVTDVVTLWSPGSGGARLELRLPAVRFREWIGAGQLRSTNFALRALGGDRWLVQGRGNGHGVGMCQWGAKVMGEKGYKTASILHHYYPDATIRKLW